MQIVCALWHKKRTPTQAAGLCHNRAREREERREVPGGSNACSAECGCCLLLLPPLPSLIVIAILHTFATRKFPHFPAQFFLLDFCLATFFHIIKADYLGRRGIVQRVLFVSMHVRKCTGQWTPSPSLSLPLCLSFAIAFMMCGCLVNPVPIMRM